MKKEIKTIDVLTLLWWDRTYGNTYFAGKVTINYGMESEETFKIPFQYGDDSMCQNHAFKELQKKEYIPVTNQSAWQYYRENNIIVRNSTHKNCKQRELKNI